MKYGEIRRALERQPTSWTLDANVRDDQEVDTFPVTDLETQPMSETEMSAADLRRAAMEAATGNPRLLPSAVEHGLLKRRDAERLLQRHWGADVTLADFDFSQ
jgi:hypothetical protein